MQRHLVPRHRVSAASLAGRVEGELWGSWVEVAPLRSILLTPGMALAVSEEVARCQYGLDRL